MIEASEKQRTKPIFWPGKMTSYPPEIEDIINVIYFKLFYTKV